MEDIDPQNPGTITESVPDEGTDERGWTMKSTMSWPPFEKAPAEPTTATEPPARSVAPDSMERFFERFMADPFGAGYARDVLESHWAGNFSPARFLPAVDVADEKAALRVTVELPGMDQKDLEVTLYDDVLVVRGEKRVESKEEKGEFYRLERAHGRFERAVPLPTAVDGDHADAKLQKGVLTVVLPKVEGARGTLPIPIQAT